MKETKPSRASRKSVVYISSLISHWPSAVCQRWRRETSCFDRSRHSSQPHGHMAWCLESTRRRSLELGRFPESESSEDFAGVFMESESHFPRIGSCEHLIFVRDTRFIVAGVMLESELHIFGIISTLPQSLPPAFLSGQLFPLPFPLRVRWSMAASPILPFLLLHGCV